VTVQTVQAVMAWGQTIRKWYGRSENADRQLDISNDYIGYYTDNGRNTPFASEL